MPSNDVLSDRIGSTWCLAMLFLAASPLTLAQCPVACLCSATRIQCTGLETVPEIPGSVGRTEISLTDGTISQIPDGFFNSDSLEGVYLRNNSLMTLSVNSFERTRRLITIDLSENNIVCDSGIEWLQLWLATYPDNNVTGDCYGGARSIQDYLNDKPTPPRIQTEVLRPFIGRDCDAPVMIPFTLTSPFTIDVTYYILLEPLLTAASANDLIVNTPEVTILAGETSASISFTISNGGGDGEVKAYLIRVRPVRPVSYELDVELRLVDGSSCVHVAPVMTTELPPPATPTSSSPPPSNGGPKVWVIILVVLFCLCAVGLVAWLIWSRCKGTPNTSAVEDTTTDNMKVHYSPVGPQAKVYNDTTEEL